MINKETIEKRFDESFVKDQGPFIEPTWKDPNGCVGPVRAFIHETITELLREVVGPLTENEVEYSPSKHIVNITKQAIIQAAKDRGYDID